MKASEVDLMTEEAAKEYLKRLIGELDELDCDDFFGTEGWRHFIQGFED